MKVIIRNAKTHQTIVFQPENVESVLGRWEIPAKAEIQGVMRNIWISGRGDRNGKPVAGQSCKVQVYDIHTGKMVRELLTTLLAE